MENGGRSAEFVQDVSSLGYEVSLDNGRFVLNLNIFLLV